MIEIDRNKCIYCGACVSVCPMLVLELNEKFLEKNESKCIKCKACEKICPIGAIKIMD